jgi:hypothetical protein
MAMHLKQCGRIWLLCAIVLGAGRAWAQGEAPGEYAVKAVFLYNISKFIEWPITLNDQMRLCILGADPFGNALSAVEGKPVGRRRFTSTRILSVHEVESFACNILFIAQSELDHLQGVLEAVRGAPVLTVGDMEGLTRDGVMISFYMEQGKVRFEINQRAAEQAGLKPSAKLLQLGRIVSMKE